MGGTLGTYQFGEQPFAGRVPIYISTGGGRYVLRTFYRVCLYKPQRAGFIAALDNISSGTWSRHGMQSSSLEIELPFNKDLYDQLRFPYLLCVQIQGVPQEWFVITKRRAIRDINNTVKVQVAGTGVLAQLGYAGIEEYTTRHVENEQIVETRKLSTVLSDLLNMQSTSKFSPIALGNVPSGTPDMDVALNEQCSSVLQALNRLREYIGGAFVVDHNFNLNWIIPDENTTPISVRIESGLLSTEIEDDYSSLRTQVKVIGRRKISDMNGREVFEKIWYTANATTQSQYGVVTDYIADSQINTSSECQYRAAMRARELGQPIVHVDCRALNLHLLDPDVGSWWDIGQSFRIVDQVLERVVETNLTGIEYDLIDPLNTRLEFGKWDTDDTIARMMQDLRRLQSDMANVPPEISDMIGEGGSGGVQYANTAETCGAYNIGGTATTVSRGDHVHRVEWLP